MIELYNIMKNIEKYYNGMYEGTSTSCTASLSAFSAVSAETLVVPSSSPVSMIEFSLLPFVKHGHHSRYRFGEP